MKNPGLGDVEGISALSLTFGMMTAFWVQDQRQAWRKQDRIEEGSEDSCVFSVQ